MPFYPDWIIALDNVAKGVPGAEITKRNAEDIIRELTQLKAQAKAVRDFVRAEREGTGTEYARTLQALRTFVQD